MVVEFRHVFFGDKFTFQGQDYIKTNFGRGYYYGENGNKVFRNFKKKTLVEDNNDFRR